MKFGVCVGEDRIGAARECGFDYVELPVSSCLNPETQDHDGFARLKRVLLAERIDSSAFNLLLPGDLRCVGPEIDMERLERYLSEVMRRAVELGGETVVFGSGGQRAVPDGFDPYVARGQLIDAFVLAADHARQYGMIVAIEPLNRTETNQVISVAEATAIARELNHPALRVLSDLYHVAREGQAYSETTDAGDLLAHVHVAGENRRAPIADDVAFISHYLRSVKAGNAACRVSIESHWDDSVPFAAQASLALESLRLAWRLA